MRTARRACRAGLGVGLLVGAALVVAVGVRPAQASAAPIIVSPAPGTATASVTTQISLLGAAAQSIRSITVTGSVSGAHRGSMERYDAEPGESFVPTTPFRAGETVTVRVGAPVVGAPSGTYRFTVAHRVAVTPPASAPAPQVEAAGVEHFASAPNLDPPSLTVRQGSGLGGGDLLLTPKGSVGNAGPEIVDSTGAVVWFDPLKGLRAFDLNEQQLGNEPVLTWWQGVVVAAHGVGTDVIMNRSYQVVARITGGNGFRPDLHEFQLEPDGAAYVTSYQAVKWNMTADGGVADGTAWDSIVQEIDVRTGLVMYEWHSLDHVSVARSDFAAPKRAGAILDYFHLNSIQPLANGDLLISSRNTSAIYEIAPRNSGAVVWSLGGKDSSFAMGPGTAFWFQHDARELSPTVISLFDDEAAPAKGTESRALELKLDLATHRASVLRVERPPTTLLASALGSVQTLAGGDVVVSWGTAPVITQYNRAGRMVFEATLPKGDDTYRLYRKAWSATPKSVPSVVLNALGGGVHAVVSWNGATAVASWRVRAGAKRTALATVKTLPKAGFQSSFSLPSSDRYLAVEALDAAGHELASSATLAVP